MGLQNHVELHGLGDLQHGNGEKPRKKEERQKGCVVETLILQDVILVPRLHDKLILVRTVLHLQKPVVMHLSLQASKLWKLDSLSQSTSYSAPVIPQLARLLADNCIPSIWKLTPSHFPDKGPMACAQDTTSVTMIQHEVTKCN